MRAHGKKGGIFWLFIEGNKYSLQVRTRFERGLLLFLGWLVS